MRPLRQNTAANGLRIGPFLDPSTGAFEDALTIAGTDMKLIKGIGTSPANKNNTASGATADATFGYYQISLNTTDTNTAGPLRLTVSVSGAMVYIEDFWVYPETVYDALFGTGALSVTLSTTGLAAVNGEVDTALSDIGLPYLVSAAVPIDFGTTVHDDSVIGHLAATSDTAAYARLTDSLQGIREEGDTNWQAEDAPTAAEMADAVWNRPAASHVTAGTFGSMLQPITAGTAQGGSANTITLASSASATDDFYQDGTEVHVIAGTGAGQWRVAAGYVGATKVLTVSENWKTNPDATSVYVLKPSGSSGGGAGGATAAEVWSYTDRELTADPGPGSAAIAAAVLASQLSESVPPSGSAATLAQMVYGIGALLGMFRVQKSGTTINVYARDETTILATYTLDDATTPTNQQRAS